MARKDIDIHIRAKDDASRNAKKAADALLRLAQDGKKAASVAGATGRAFADMQAGLAKLDTGSLRDFGKIVGQMDKARSAVERLGTQLAGSTRSFEQVRRQANEAAKTSEQLRNQIQRESSAQETRNRILDSTTAKQKANTEALKAAQRAQEALNGARRKGVTTRGNVASAGVGLESGAPRSSARDSFNVFLGAEIASAEREKARLNSAINGLNTAISTGKSTLKGYSDELRQASALERDLNAEVERTGNSVLSTRADLHKAQQTLAELEGDAKRASSALGGLAANQDAIANASRKAAAQLVAMQARVAALTGRPAYTAVPKADDDGNRRAQIENLRDLTQEYAKAQIAAQTLGKAMAQAEAPTDELAESFGRARAQVAQLKQAINEQRSALRTQGSFSALGASTTTSAGVDPAAVKNLGQIAPLAQRAATGMRGLSSASEQATSNILGFGRNTRTTLSFLQRMRGEVLALTTGFIGFYAVLERGRSAMDSFMAVQRAENRLGVAFSGDTKKVASEIAYLNSEADRLGFTFATLADGYGKISISAQNAGFSIADTRQLFTSLSEAARVNGSSMDEMNGVLRALDQMLSKGKIQAEELRGQLGDRMSGAFKMFADGLGVTTQELDEMLKKGEVMADRDTLLKFANRLSQAYGSRVPAAMRTLAASLGTFERDMEKVNLQLANGFVPAVQEALKAFHEFASSADGQQTFSRLGSAAGQLISILLQIPQYFDEIAFGIKALIALKVAQWGASIIGAFSRAGSAVSQMGRQMALVGPRVQQLSVSETLLARSVSAADVVLRRQQSTLARMTTTTAVARVGITALSGSIGLLRGALVLTAGAARSLIAALGGPIGIAIMAVTYGITSWATKTDAATAAMDTHRQHVEAVKAAYAGATGEADKLKRVAAAVSLPEAEKVLGTANSAYSKALSQIEKVRKGLAAWKVAYENVTDAERAQAAGAIDDMAKIEAALDKFASDNDADGLVSTLNALYDSFPEGPAKRYAEQLLEVATGGDDAAQSLAMLQANIKSAQAVIDAAKGKFDDTTKSTIGLSDGIDITSRAFSDNSKHVDTYTEAIDELREKIPSLAEEMKKMKAITELNTVAWNGLVAAWNAGDYSKILEIAALWGGGQAEIAAQNTNWEAVYTAGRGAPEGAQTEELVRAVTKLAEQMGLSAKDLLTAMSYETGGTFNPGIKGGAGGKYVGLIQFSPDNQAKYGVNEASSVTDQVVAAGKYLQDAGVKAGDGLLQIYAAINAGSPTRIHASDAGNGGAPGTVLDKVSGQMEGHKGRAEGLLAAYGGVVEQTRTLTEEEKKAAEEREKAEKATKERLADQDYEIVQQKLINAGKEREAAIQEAVREAQAENKNISDQELASIREKAGALWDLNNATKERELAEERLNQLYELRQQLMDQRQMALEQGDLTKADALKTQIAGVNEQLNEAIPKLIAMWQAVGGPEADAAIAKLNTMSMSIKAGEDRTGKFGLSFDTWFGVFQSAVQGVVGSFQAFSQAIAEGENAFQAFGQSALSVLASVLQQIAAAIIQMQILKMLQGFGGGIGQMAIMMLGGMTGHTGGLVGSRAIGSGNSIRPSGWVANAYAGPYHTGGIAGLRPDEVSATLKRNEEILTEEDPRHRFNQGGESRKSEGTRLKQVLAIGDREIADAMAGSAGEQVQLTTIKRNSATIRRMLGL